MYTFLFNNSLIQLQTSASAYCLSEFVQACVCIVCHDERSIISLFVALFCTLPYDLLSILLWKCFWPDYWASIWQLFWSVNGSKKEKKNRYCFSIYGWILLDYCIRPVLELIVALAFGSSMKLIVNSNLDSMVQPSIKLVIYSGVNLV